MLSLREQTPRSRAEIRPIVSPYCTASARVMYDSDPERKSETPLLTGTPPPAVSLLHPIPLVLLREPRGSLTGERRVEETVYGLSFSLPPRLFFRFLVAKSVGPNVSEVGMVQGLAECIRVSQTQGGLRESPLLPLRLPLRHLPAREPSRFPSSPRSPRSFFPTPLPSRERTRRVEKEREKERDRERQRGEKGSRGDLWST